MKNLTTQIQEACIKLNNHGVISFPTETVMGLGVIYDDFSAYQKMNVLKERREDKPYSMMIGEVDNICLYAEQNEKIERTIKHFLPGSVTFLLKSKNVPDWVTHSTGVIGIRIPTNIEAIELLKAIQKPLLVPSANPAGKAPALNDKEVSVYFGKSLDYIISGEAKGGLATTIVDLTKDEPKLVREGPIPFDEILKVYKGEE